ncbi:MAG: hypothetical protein AB7K71_00080 [Polyangiaceae bacterium]
MRGVLVGLALLLTCGFASLGCSSLLGLDEFGAAETAAGGTGGAGGIGGAGGSAAGMGGVAGMGGTSSAGTGGADPFAHCPLASVTVDYFEPSVKAHLTVYQWELTLNIDGDEFPAGITVYSKIESVGSYDLSEPDEHAAETCNTCVALWLDSKRYYPAVGTFNIDTISEESNAPHAGEMFGLAMVEADDLGAIIPGGKCLRLPRIAWDFREYDYPQSTISALRMGAVKDNRRVTISNAVVTVGGANFGYIQQGGGFNSAIPIGADTPLNVGDRITVKAQVKGVGTDFLSLAVEPGGITLLDTAQQVIVVQPDTSLQQAGWLGALVRLSGPFTITESATYDTFTLVPSQGSSVLGSQQFFMTPGGELTPDVPQPGATMDAVTGIVVPSSTGVYAVAPRDLNDLEGYVPAP